MSKENLRMQMLAGIITEGQYKAKLNEMEFLRYTTGLDMKQFTHIPELSSYNSNYYKGLGDDIIYGKSDDNDTTVWYLIIGMDEEFYLGESYTSEGDKLYRYEEEQY